MKGDFTRQTFDSTRHFTTVRMQQGRVQLDADWNEQADLALYRVETEAADVIGGCGGPLDAAGFEIVLSPDELDPAEQARLQALDPPYAIVAGDFVLTPGRYYVDGILCVSEHAVPYTLQPDLPGRDPMDVSQVGFTIVYLDVWQRHLTWLDDPLLRETALGGPDTATRTKTVWQVRSVFVGAGPVTCVDDPQAYLDAIAAGTGLLSARAKREDAAEDPCIVPASAGYRGLENQLYRVEIHAPGDAYDLTPAPGDQAITVVAPDRVVYAGASSWTVGQAVEIFRSAAGSDPMEGWLATVVARDTSTKTLTLNRSLPDLGSGDVPRIRPIEATLKWSRDNGSVVTLVSSVTAREVVVTSLGPDQSSFLPGQWIEVVDEVTELDGRPGFLSEIEDVDVASRTVTLRVEPPAFAGKILKLRRWDGVGGVKTNPPGTAEPFVELEDGVQISFSDGTYRTGDYWLIPARTATADERSGTIEWPVEDDEPLELPPLGIRHHYCKLAVLESDGTTLEVDDCRSLFPPLTQLATLAYVGGDGQEARPGQPVPQLLEAGVFRGRRPVEGARVRFTADAGGNLAADLASVPGGTVTFERVTGADGIAACAWLPANDLTKLSQQVEARLLDAGGNPLAPRLDYSGQLSIAAEVAYIPGECADLASATTVQEALDILCNRPTGGSCCVVVEPGTQLDEVLTKLIDEDVRDISLCLKPGDYKLEMPEIARGVVSTLAIEGCGAGARVEVGGFQLDHLDEVRLRGLDLLLRTKSPLVFDRCAEVAIESCRITRAVAPGPVCMIGGAQRVRIADCLLDGRVGVDEAHLEDLRELIALPAFEFASKATDLAEELVADIEARKDLATKISRARRTARLSPGEQEAYRLLADTLRDEVGAQSIVAGLGRLRTAAAFAFAGPALVLLDGGAEALIDATDVVGMLVLYGLPPGKLPDEGLLKQVGAALADGRLVLRGGGSLHLREVRMTQITVGEPMLEQLSKQPDGEKVAGDVFRALHIAGTEVLVNGNLAVAEDATLDGVDFAGQQDDVGALIAESAIVTACRAPNDFRLFVSANALETAANLRINVVEIA
ncbi:MAG: DUF6519 domain-containing protein [Gaiellaceae bacterium]